MESNKRKKIVVVDPRSSLIHLVRQLADTGWHIEEIFSSSCSLDLAIKRNDISEIAFALSGSDIGLSIAHAINIKCGNAGVINSDILYNKISQYEFLQDFNPSLVFDNTQVFDSKIDLFTYLHDSKLPIIVRPDVSYINGSALFSKFNNTLSLTQIDTLFSSAVRVITHTFVEGTSFLINGLVVQGELFLTDSWQCFNISANNRNILTSVINHSTNDPMMLKIKPILQKLTQALMLDFSPIHFEIIFCQGQFKIVKFVPRFATEPLPSLCHLSGSNSQLDCFKQILSSAIPTSLTMNDKPKSYVADYSFVVRNAGYLEKIPVLSKVMKLSSYNNIYFLPAKGAFLSLTTCGSTYGATILLANSDKDKLVADIQFCQRLNDTNAFTITNIN